MERLKNTYLYSVKMYIAHASYIYTCAYMYVQVHCICMCIVRVPVCKQACVYTCIMYMYLLVFSLTHLACVHMDSMILPKLTEDKPCYIFYRLDERNAHQNYLWVFMAYTPDSAKVSAGMANKLLLKG